MPVYDIIQITRARLRYSVEADNPAHAMALLENGDANLADDETLDVSEEFIIDRLTSQRCDDEADRRHEVTAYPIEGKPHKWGALDSEGGQVPGEFDSEPAAISAAVQASKWD
jgi:hypothetical protein